MYKDKLLYLFKAMAGPTHSLDSFLEKVERAISDNEYNTVFTYKTNGIDFIVGAWKMTPGASYMWSIELNAEVPKNVNKFDILRLVTFVSEQSCCELVYRASKSDTEFVGMLEDHGFNYYKDTNTWSVSSSPSNASDKSLPELACEVGFIQQTRCAKKMTMIMDLLYELEEDTGIATFKEEAERWKDIVTEWSQETVF